MDKITPAKFDEPDSQLRLLLLLDRKFDWTFVITKLEQRFKYYITSSPELRKLDDTPAELSVHKEALLKIYDSKSKLAQEIRDKVRAIHDKKCPYCGEPTEPVTIDHFVPKSAHSEFSLFSGNLLPSCWSCNHTKLAEVWDTSSGNRLFLNPLSDTFLGQPFFRITVLPGPNGFDDPILDLKLIDDLGADEKKIAYSHLDKLGITQKLFKNLLIFVRVIRRAYRKSLDAGTLTIAIVREDLLSKGSAISAERGLNCWDAIFHRTILENPDYLSFIATVPFVESTLSPVPRD